MDYRNISGNFAKKVGSLVTVFYSGAHTYFTGSTASNLTLTSGTAITLKLNPSVTNDERYDAANNRFIVPVSGWYHITHRLAVSRDPEYAGDLNIAIMNGNGTVIYAQDEYLLREVNNINLDTYLILEQDTFLSIQLTPTFYETDSAGNDLISSTLTCTLKSCYAQYLLFS